MSETNSTGVNPDETSRIVTDGGEPGDDSRELKDHERAVPIMAFNKIESKLHRAEQRLREGRVVDAHQEVTDAHRELSKHKEGSDDELVTDGGEPVGDTDTSIDTERGGDDYTELSITVSEDALEGLAHGSSATYEFPVQNGGTLAVTVEGDGEFDKDWLLESIGAKEQPQPQPYKTIAALAVFGASLSVATMLSPAWTMIPAAVPMLLAGMWIIDEVRRGYGRGSVGEEATA